MGLFDHTLYLENDSVRFDGFSYTKHNTTLPKLFLIFKEDSA